MKIIRSPQGWRVTDMSSYDFHLEVLAHRGGYRVDALCEALGCSQRHLYTVFTRDIGLTPKEWLGQQRMVIARHKLAGGRSSADRRSGARICLAGQFPPGVWYRSMS